MSFLSPFTLAGLLLVALPVTIHLLARRRARRLDFPSLEFLRETPSFKLHPRRIRKPLLLALRVAALAALVLGLARPLFNFQTKAREGIRFILLDASLSMKAGGRAEAAKEQARAVVNNLAGGERAAVIVFSSGATALASPTEDRRELLEAINRYSPAGGASDYGAALREASGLVGREAWATGEVHIISDFQQTGLEGRGVPATAAAPLRVVTHAVGSEVGRNAFLIDEGLSRKGGNVELSAAEMVSEPDGRSGARRSWTIVEEGGAGPGIEWKREANGQVTGRLTTLEPDEFDGDDERFFAFSPPAGEPRVLLIEDGTDASMYLRAALEAAGDGRGGIALDRRGDLPGDAKELAPYSLVALALHGAARENQSKVLAEYARGGGTVWLCLGRDLDTNSWNGAAAASDTLPFESVARIEGQPLSFGATDTDAPALRSLDEGAAAALRAVRVRDGYALATRANADTLVRWSDGRPALVSGRVGTGEILLLATSPERASSELGSSPSFPALASSILDSAVATREPLSNSIGEPVRLGLAPSTEVRITDAQGRVVTATARELIRRPLDYFNEPGVYGLEFEGGKRFLAFNSPESESERALATEDALKGFFHAGESETARAAPATAAEDAGREAAERRGNAWRYFLVAAFLLLVAELFAVTGRRRGTVEG